MEFKYGRRYRLPAPRLGAVRTPNRERRSSPLFLRAPMSLIACWFGKDVSGSLSCVIPAFVLPFIPFFPSLSSFLPSLLPSFLPLLLPSCLSKTLLHKMKTNPLSKKQLQFHEVSPSRSSTRSSKGLILLMAQSQGTTVQVKVAGSLGHTQGAGSPKPVQLLNQSQAEAVKNPQVHLGSSPLKRRHWP